VQRNTLKVRRRREKPGRFEARIPTAQKQLLERAASLRGTSLTDFVLGSAQEASTRTIKDFEMLTLHAQASDAFLNALLNPPAPNQALQAAADRYRKHF